MLSEVGHQVLVKLCLRELSEFSLLFILHFTIWVHILFLSQFLSVTEIYLTGRNDDVKLHAHSFDDEPENQEKAKILYL